MKRHCGRAGLLWRKRQATIGAILAIVVSLTVFALLLTGCDDADEAKIKPSPSPPTLPEAQKTTAVLALLKEASDIAERLPSGSQQDNFLRSVAVSQAIAGQVPSAQTTISLIKSSIIRTDAADIVGEPTRGREWKRWQPKITPPSQTERLRRVRHRREPGNIAPRTPTRPQSAADRIAISQTEFLIASQDLDNARQTAKTIKDGRWRVIELLKVFEAYIANSLTSKAHETLLLAEGEAGSDELVLRDVATIGAGGVKKSFVPDNASTLGDVPEAERIARRLTTRDYHDDALANIGIIIASNGDVAGAEKLGTEITSPQIRARMVSTIIEGLLNDDSAKTAAILNANVPVTERLANSISPIEMRDTALALVAGGYIRVKNPAGAIGVAARISDPYIQCETYRDIARFQWEMAADYTGAHSTAKAAFESALKIPDNRVDPVFDRTHWRDQSLALTALTQVAVNDIDGATISLQKIQNPTVRCLALIQSADLLLISPADR